MRNVVWLDLAGRGHSYPKAVIKNGQISPQDAFSIEGTNILYDEETGMVFTLTTDSGVSTNIVAETLEQYEPGEL